VDTSSHLGHQAMTTIVFSKDRAMQLDAFLRSYEKHVMPLSKVYVLFAASSYRHEKAYEYAHRLFHFATFVQQTTFKDDVLRLLPKDGTVVFYVDDQVFIHPWFVTEKPGLSLRLGLNLTRDYAFGDRAQNLPPYEAVNDSMISWRWADGELSWRYPLSVDGHVFDADMLRTMIEQIEFHSPNTLESALQQFVPYFLERYGTCYRQSKVVNVPWTRVQTDYDNRYAGFSADDMLEQWEAGNQINLSQIDGALNESVHQEFPLILEPR
jgi:hypothetical protein